MATAAAPKPIMATTIGESNKSSNPVSSDNNHFSFFSNGSSPTLRFPNDLIAALNAKTPKLIIDVICHDRLDPAYQLSPSIINKLITVYQETLTQPLQYLLLKAVKTEDNELIGSNQTTLYGVIAYLTAHYADYQAYMVSHGYPKPDLQEDYQFALNLFRECAQEDIADEASLYPKHEQAIDAFLLGLTEEQKAELTHFTPHQAFVKSS